MTLKNIYFCFIFRKLSAMTNFLFFFQKMKSKLTMFRFHINLRYLYLCFDFRPETIIFRTFQGNFLVSFFLKFLELRFLSVGDTSRYFGFMAFGIFLVLCLFEGECHFCFGH